MEPSLGATPPSPPSTQPLPDPSQGATPPAPPSTQPVPAAPQSIAAAPALMHRSFFVGLFAAIKSGEEEVRELYENRAAIAKGTRAVTAETRLMVRGVQAIANSPFLGKLCTGVLEACDIADAITAE